MQIVIPDNLLSKIHIPPECIKKEFALFFFKKYDISPEQASLIADIPISEFKKLLSLEYEKLNTLEPHDYIIDDPDKLISIDWSEEWQADDLP